MLQNWCAYSRGTPGWGVVRHSVASVVLRTYAGDQVGLTIITLLFPYIRPNDLSFSMLLPAFLVIVLIFYHLHPCKRQSCCSGHAVIQRRRQITCQEGLRG